MRGKLLPLLLLCASTTPALAQDRVGTDAWTTQGSMIRAARAGITVPQSAGPLAIVKTGEISDPGAGIDNYAQYMSADNVIQATAYIYRPSFADTAIAALSTERAIMDRFGPSTRRTRQSLSAAGGHEGAALRIIYEEADEGRLVMAAAFIHAGDWIVKLRVTGPSDRASDVTAGMDALLKGLSFDAGLVLHSAHLLSVTDCPAADGAQARIIEGKSASQETGVTQFPRDGRDSICRRGMIRVGLTQFDMLQPARAGANGPLLVPTDDAGGMLEFQHGAAADGYQLIVHEVGKADSYSRYDRLPTTAQIAAIIDGSDTGATQKLASTADGRSQ